MTRARLLQAASWAGVVLFVAAASPLDPVRYLLACLGVVVAVLADRALTRHEEATRDRPHP